MAPTDEEPGRTRPVLVGLAALVAVSLLIGGLVAALAFGAARVAGLGEQGSARPAADPSLVVPSGEPTTRPQAFPDPARSTTSDPSPSASEPSSSPTEKKTRPRPLTLQAFPRGVAAGERINLTGTYRGQEGASLRVERKRGGGEWTDFGVSATVSGGTYATYIFTGQTGRNRLRMVDDSADRASNAVSVQVG